MVLVILGMLLALGLALFVVGVVTIPAVRDGETLLTPEGQERVAEMRGRAGDTVSSARERITSSR